MSSLPDLSTGTLRRKFSADFPEPAGPSRVGKVMGNRMPWYVPLWCGVTASPGSGPVLDWFLVFVFWALGPTLGAGKLASSMVMPNPGSPPLEICALNRLHHTLPVGSRPPESDPCEFCGGAAAQLRILSESLSLALGDAGDDGRATTG
ncbi:hypothetical protein HGRIS_003742 [Hohenbuehelia grisea]|uniref:Uncharacterized protein n=1 Tax=Hohenbuehelia grisea TaxID=104357 RepID=A0ABR3JH53_9AGAR